MAGRGGVTLVEVVVSAFLLAVITLCLIPALHFAAAMTRLNSHRRIADQVLGYGAGLLALAATGTVLAAQPWRGLAAYGAAWAVAVAVLWWRLARHQGDAQGRNAAVLLGALLGLAIVGTSLHAVALP